MKGKKKWYRIGFRLGLALLGTAVLILIYAFWPIQEDLSALVPPEGQYNVAILRDTWGVPHIFGQTDADSAYGLGYAHAEDDFFTIQQTLIAARGMLGQAFGLDSVPVDYALGWLRIRERVAAQYATNLSPEVRAVVEAYADGLNHYAALHPDETIPGLYPVTGQDVVAGFAQRTPLFFGLDSALTELFAEERQRAVTTKAVTSSQVPAVSYRSPASKYGSNTFAVAPSRTAAGETFFAVNAHQPWEGPVAWYEAHVHSEEGWDMVGGTFPGAPLILHGHNRDLGWAFTVNSPDLIDVYVLDINPDNPNQYSFDGEWRDLEVWDVPLKVKLLGRLTWTVKQEALWSVYGPTVRQPHGTYAIRYAGMDEIRYVEQWFRLNKAANFDEWQAAMSMGAIPMFHVGYADKEGNIGYFYNGRIPQRAEGYAWQLYLPGDTSETLWTDYVPFAELPHVVNPPSGFVQDANSNPFIATFGPGNPNPADFSPTMGIDTRVSSRSLRLLELFQADESVTYEAFVAYKYDMFYAAESDVPKWISQVLNADLPGEANIQQAAAILSDWDLQTNEESVGATIFELTLNFAAERENVSLAWDAMTNTPVPTEALVAGLIEAVDFLMTHYGRVDVSWSEVNRLRRGSVDLGLGGASDIVHAVYGEMEEDGRFRGMAGDSYVLLVTWDANGVVSSESIHQYGSATSVENSPHYADQAPLFVNRELKPVWYDEAEIRAHLEREYAPGHE